MASSNSRELTLTPFSTAFPLDVERVIMEMAAQDEQVTLALALVAKRIQAWVEPFLYEGIYVDEAHGERLLESTNASTKPLSFYHDSIKHIRFDYNPAPVFKSRVSTDPEATEHLLPSVYKALLPRCSGVTRIVSTYHPWEHIPHLAQLFADMRPMRFCGFLHDLLNPSHPDFSAPFFTRITHLKISDPSWYHWSGFDQLPCLTHIAVAPFPFRKEMVTERTRKAVGSGITRILTQCRIIRVLLVLRSEWSWSEGSKGYVDVDDDRIVLLQKDDIAEQKGNFTSGRHDMWDRVEARIAREKHSRRVTK